MHALQRRREANGAGQSHSGILESPVPYSTSWDTITTKKLSLARRDRTKNLGLFGARLAQEGLCRPVKELHLVHEDGHFVMGTLTWEKEALGGAVPPKHQLIG